MIKVKSHRGKYEVHFVSIDKIDITRLSKTYLVIDASVDKYYPALRALFPEDRIVVIEATEENKTLSACERVIESLVERNIKKDNYLLAVGGGIIQDITAFVASILFRGIEWQFVPTTLLAQADSCIGSKTSINFGKTKNLLGTFYPPSRIWCDTTFLNTLTDEEILSGIGEILHYYLLDDSPFTEELVELALSKNRDRLKKHIVKSLSIKKKMVEMDEFDKGPRNVFNYGHTFGHAIEALTEYKIPHGVAVIKGMHMANYVALAQGYINSTRMHELSSQLTDLLPEFNIVDTELLDYYISLLRKDKKSTEHAIVCILPKKKSFGKVTIYEDSMKKTLEAYFRLYP